MADKRPLSIYSGNLKEISDADVSEIPGLKCIGGVSYSVVTKTGTYTTTLSDHTIRCNSASDFPITLHSAASAYNSTDNTGQELVFKNVNSGTVTIDANSTETIDGKTTVSIAQYGTLTLRSNGTNWDIVNKSAGYEGNGLRKYTTGWVACSDWTDQNLGTTLGGYVEHNLGRDLKDLYVKVLVSSNGTDNVSWEITNNVNDGATDDIGVLVYGGGDGDKNTIQVRTGANGAAYLHSSTGATTLLTTDPKYYKIEVYDLTSAGGDSYWAQDGNDIEYTAGSVNLNTLKLLERSSDPGTPDEGSSYIWQSDGTGSGDDGDIMVKITAGGTTKTATLIDFSAI